MVQAESLLHLGLILVTIAGLWIGARLLVGAAIRLARRFALSEATIGLTIVAAGTSLPELAVSADAAAERLSDIALANILGSNIYNLAFILGIIARLRVIPVAEGLLHRDGIEPLVSTLIGGLAILNLTITRLEGVAMAGLFVVYASYLLRSGQVNACGQPHVLPERAPGDTRLERVPSGARDTVALLTGLAVILLSADFLVLGASELARTAGIADWVIGATIVAAGTSTPEFAVSLVG